MLIYKTARLLRSISSRTSSQFFHQRGYKSGDSYKVTMQITQTDVDQFSNLTGDHNPIHKIGYTHPPVVHGAFLNGLISGVIGTKFPGPGSMVVSQNMSFPNKCYVGKHIELEVTLVEARKIMKIVYDCKQDGIIVFQGDAKIIHKTVE